MDKAAKAEARIKAVCERLGITPGGRLWLDCALDPFKDIVQKPIGYPDRNMAPTVIQTVHDSIEVVKPTSIGPGAWDCNIFLDEVWRSVDLFQAYDPVANNLFERLGQDTTPYRRGGLVVRSALAGSPLTILTTQNAQCLSLVTDVFDNAVSARVIAIGLEIHNTTAEIYKQGSIIPYRISDQSARKIYTACDNSAIISNTPSCSGTDLSEPPATGSQAIDLPGSVQWDAAKGVYLVPTFSSEGNDPQDLIAMVTECTDYTSGLSYVPVMTRVGGTVLFDQTSTNVNLPTTLSGAFLQGLSESTSLTVNLTYYVEQFPSFSSNLHRISAPSCPEDFPAIELYTKVSRLMPTGVEVNDNFLGAFIAGVSRVLSTVSTFAPMVFKGINSATELYDDYKKVSKERAPARNESVSNDRAIVPYKPASASKEIITIANDKTVTVTVPSPARARNGNSAARTVRSRPVRVKSTRDPDYNRLDRYIKAGNAGNKFIM